MKWLVLSNRNLGCCDSQAWPCNAAEAAAFLRYYNEIQEGNYKRLTKRFYGSAYTTTGKQN